MADAIDTTDYYAEIGAHPALIYETQVATCGEPRAISLSNAYIHTRYVI